MMKVAKKDGEKEELDEGKLWDSLYWPAREAHHSYDDAVELADQVKEDLMQWLHEHEDNVATSKEIRDKAIELLEEVDHGIRLMYEKHLDIN